MKSFSLHFEREAMVETLSSHRGSVGVAVMRFAIMPLGNQDQKPFGGLDFVSGRDVILFFACRDRSIGL